MQLRYRFLFTLGVMLCLAISASAQVQTGTPPFGSYAGGPDVINLANLNAHWTIPVLHKPGRGTNFVYDLNYDSSVYFPVSEGSSKTWIFSPGWSYETVGVSGTVSYSSSYTTTYQSCGPDQSQLQITTWTYSNWVYTDPKGVGHNYNSSRTTTVYSGCSQNSSQSTSFNETAADGSGFTLVATGACAPCGVTNSSGVTFSLPGSTSLTDRNGNQITSDGSGHFYDTLSSTDLPPGSAHRIIRHSNLLNS